MLRNEYKPSVNGMAISFLVLLNTIFLKAAYVDNKQYYWALAISLPLLLFAIWDRAKK
jgi:hypothetical protein